MTENRVSFDLDCSILSNTIHTQKGATCYAHAIATVLASAERRIEGRTPKDHETIVSEIIENFGSSGCDVWKVLEVECMKRRLRFQMLRTDEKAKYWVKRRHALVAGFDLNNNQWEDLTQFLEHEPHNILTVNHFSKSQVLLGEKFYGGHAVTIGGYDEKENYWIIKNSWGEESGDHGYWRVSVDSGLKWTYHHVYFLIEDLTDNDIFNYIIKHGFDDEINVELYKRGTAQEFETRYCEMIHQKMLNKLCDIFKALRACNRDFSVSVDLSS